MNMMKSGYCTHSFSDCVSIDNLDEPDIINRMISRVSCSSILQRTILFLQRCRGIPSQSFLSGCLIERMIELDETLRYLTSGEANRRFFPRDEIVKRYFFTSLTESQYSSARISQGMLLVHKLIIGNQEFIRDTALPKITITLNRKGGNKITSRIQYLSEYGIDADSFSDALKLKCASSTSIDDIPKIGKEVMVQGDQTSQILQLLQESGFPVSGTYPHLTSKHVEIIDKTKKKKK